MKKLTTLLVAFLFTAGMAFAQSNEATIDQVEDGNVADVVQQGLSNTTTIDQTSEAGFVAGEGHLADVFQSGENNTATVEQDYLGSVANTLAHSAFIEQLGDNNVADVLQTRNQLSNIADILQDGHRNYAGVQQQDGAIFDAVQDGDDNRIEGITTDRAEQRTGNALPGSFNVMDFEQFGNNNLIQARQFDTAVGGGGPNTMTIHQHGADNIAVASQRNPNNVIDIMQDGDWNVANVTQSAD